MSGTTESYERDLKLSIWPQTVPLHTFKYKFTDFVNMHFQPRICYIVNPQDKRLTSVPWGRVSPGLSSNIPRDEFGGLGRGEPVRVGPLDKSTFTTVEHILEVFMIRIVKDLNKIQKLFLGKMSRR